VARPDAGRNLWGVALADRYRYIRTTSFEDGQDGMRKEIEDLVEDIKRSIGLLRRHL
jgi:hypothetical protein